MKKRLISLLLAFSMMLTFLPAGAVSAFAEAGETIGEATIVPTPGHLIATQGGDWIAFITQPGTYYLSGDYARKIGVRTTDDNADVTIIICITKISTFLILCDLAVCLATLYVSFSLVFALMRYLQGKVFLIRFYSPTTLSSSRAEFRLPSRLACA